MNHSEEKILAVDDQAANLEIYELLLGDVYRLELARSGSEGLELASVFKPDLILLDIMMPGIDGYATCRRLRTDLALRFVKIILVSADGDIDDRLSGYESGADDFIAKPFDDEELLAKVRIFLRLKFSEEVNQLKTDVLSLLCHETRTPLNYIIAPAEMLATDISMEASKRREWARMILQGTNRLQNLFEKALLLSMSKAGNLDLCKVDFDLVEEIGLAIDATADASEQGRPLIELNLPPSLAVRGSDEHLRFVIKAILDNAIRFGRSEEAIVVELDSRDGCATLSITDRGVGIDPTVLPHLFDEMAISDVSHHGEGHGLSLALSRAIVENHGGEIHVDSEPGVRTRFLVRLPLAGGDEAPAD